MQRSLCAMLADRLVQAVPRLAPLYTEHRSDYEQVLPHVFLGDVTRFVTQAFTDNETGGSHAGRRRDAIEVLRVLDEALATGESSVLELVSVSFLENIEWATPEGHLIRTAIGPRLREELLRREKSEEEKEEEKEREKEK